MKATLIITAATILSKVLGFGREAALAAVFGASKLTDSYIVAQMLPNILFNVVASALATTAIPVLSDYLHNPEKRPQYDSLVTSVINSVLIVVIAMLVIAFAFTPFIIRVLAPGFVGEQQQLTIALSRIMLPSIILMALSGMFTALLQTHNHFTAPALVAVPHNIILIAAIFISGSMFGIYGVAVGTLIGIFSQVLIQVPPLLKQKIHYNFKVDFNHPGLRQIMILLVPVLIGVGAHEINVVIDRSLASGLIEGSVSALNYAQRAIALPYGLLVVPLITVLYPALSADAATGSRASYANMLERGLRVLMFLMVPVTIGMLVLQNDFIRLLYQRGAFGPDATRLTVIAFLFYGIGMPFTAWESFLNRSVYAMQDTRLPMIAGLIQVGLNIVGNLILVRYMAHGGLALATSIASFVCMVFLLVHVKRRTPELNMPELMGEVGRMLVAGAVMGVGLYLIDKALPLAVFTALFGWIPGLGSLAAGAARLGIEALLGLGIYAAVAMVLKTKTLGEALATGKRMAGRRLKRA
jgi:putative peptidoglycan lipid II flippase